MLAEVRFNLTWAGNVFRGERSCRVLPLNSGLAAMHLRN